MKSSNFSAARAHLERAMDHLSGLDETTVNARMALDLLIEAVMLAEHSPQPREVIPFPERPRPEQRQQPNAVDVIAAHRVK